MSTTAGAEMRLLIAIVLVLSVLAGGSVASTKAHSRPATHKKPPHRGLISSDTLSTDASGLGVDPAVSRQLLAGKKANKKRHPPAKGRSLMAETLTDNYHVFETRTEAVAERQLLGKKAHKKQHPPAGKHRGLMESSSTSESVFEASTEAVVERQLLGKEAHKKQRPPTGKSRGLLGSSTRTADEFQVEGESASVERHLLAAKKAKTAHKKRPPPSGSRGH